MENIWSENKYVNLTINVLLFLMATNFLHFGYLLLPIVCLLLLIDNKLKFKVHNIKIFVILCMFGITFFIFSYELGLYSLFGMFLPMAYYIGSNIKNNSIDHTKNIIYLLMFGMATHVILNCSYELFVRGFETFARNSHLDIWTGIELPTTQIAVNYIYLLSTIYYMFVYENKTNIKKFYSVVLILCLIYEIALARRTPIFVLLISILLSIIYDKVANKNNTIKFRKIIIIILVVLVLGVVYYLFFYDPWANRESLQIFNKLFFSGLKTNRIKIFIDAINIAPQHLWGGQEIKTIFNINIHDLWMDTFDYAGIIPYILLVIYSIYCSAKMIETMKNNELSKSFKLLVFVLFVCITIQMFLEPIITGSPVFLLCSIIVFTSIECLNSK